jgi:hypothetical protein
VLHAHASSAPGSVTPFCRSGKALDPRRGETRERCDIAMSHVARTRVWYPADGESRPSIVLERAVLAVVDVEAEAEAGLVLLLLASSPGSKLQAVEWMGFSDWDSILFQNRARPERASPPLTVCCFSFVDGAWDEVRRYEWGSSVVDLPRALSY